jgi:hypothetical protein
MSPAFRYFHLAQPQPTSGYIARLEHAFLVVLTDTYAHHMHVKPESRQIYNEATRLEARERLAEFFTAISKRAETGAYTAYGSHTQSLVNIIFAAVCQIRGKISDLRYHGAEEQQLSNTLKRILNTIIAAPLFEIAEETSYALPALAWHIAHGDLSYGAGVAHRIRNQFINNLSSHALEDRDCFTELLEDNDFTTCHDCGDWAHSDTTHVPHDHDNNVCTACIDNNYRYSEYYEEYVYADQARWGLDRDGDEVLFHEDDDNFSYDDDEDTYVHHAFGGRKPQLLGSYHNRARVGKQPFINSDWTSRNNRFMGVELEVEVRDGSIDDHVEALNAKFNDGEVGKRVYFEADGSLTHGFEIITNPMGLDSHYDLWSAFNSRDLTRGMRSHDTSTCGLHVHVSRKNMHVMQLNKMNVFLNHPDNQELIKAVARRYNVNYARIAQKNLATAHKYDIERRDALNITNDHTVEFRIFKGTLVYDTLLSAIEFANAVVNFTMPASSAGFHLSTPRFLDFIDSPSQRSETKYLRKHLVNTNIMS